MHTALVLDVLVRSGSLATWRPIMVGLSETALQEQLLTWIAGNQAIYGGQYRIMKVPFLMPKAE